MVIGFYFEENFTFK